MDGSLSRWGTSQRIEVAHLLIFFASSFSSCSSAFFACKRSYKSCCRRVLPALLQRERAQSLRLTYIARVTQTWWCFRMIFDKHATGYGALVFTHHYNTASTANHLKHLTNLPKGSSGFRTFSHSCCRTLRFSSISVSVTNDLNCSLGTLPPKLIVEDYTKVREAWMCRCVVIIALQNCKKSSYKKLSQSNP